MNTEFELICPHCGEQILLESLKEHNSSIIETFLAKQWEAKKIKLINAEVEIFQERFEKEKEFELDLLKSNMINNFSKEKNQLTLDLELKNQELVAKEQQIFNEIEAIKLKTQNEVKDKINSLNEIINNLNQTIKTNQSHFEALNVQNKLNTEMSIMNKETELKQVFEMTKRNLEEDYHKKETLMRDQIEELRIANAQSKILQNKTKGENFEVEVESELRKCLGAFDRIEKATTSIENTKPDFLQMVKNDRQEIIGNIVYEVKNAAWNNNWETKLSVDVIKNSGNFGVLIATSFEDKFKGVPFIKSEKHDNIWITNSESFVFVGQLLRNLIILENKYRTEMDEIQKFAGASTDLEIQTIKEDYENKIQSIKEFWTKKAPRSIEICRRELMNLDGVARTLDASSTKVKKARERITKHLENNLIKNLEEIMTKNFAIIKDEEIKEVDSNTLDQQGSIFE